MYYEPFQMFKAAVNEEVGLRSKPKKSKSPKATHHKSKARRK